MLGFLESLFTFFFMVSALDFYISNTRSFHWWALKTNHATYSRKFSACFLPTNCAEISKVTSSGGNLILRDLGPPEAKALDLKYSSCIRLWNTTMKNWFCHHLENFISFPLIYSFAVIRCVLTELEADNWKHRSNYMVTLSAMNISFYPDARMHFWNS